MDPTGKPISMLFSNKSTQRWLYQAADSCANTQGAKYWNSFQNGRPTVAWVVVRLHVGCEKTKATGTRMGLKMGPGNCISQRRFLTQYMLPLCVISQVSEPGLMTSTSLASLRKASWSIVRSGSIPTTRKTLLFHARTFHARKRTVCRQNSALDLWMPYCVAEYARNVDVGVV